MRDIKKINLVISLSLMVLITGCAAPKKFDYSAFKQSRPRSILILPPLNKTPDINGGYGFLSRVTYPLAESGYYVLPVTLVNETFKQNGLSIAADIHAVPLPKLKEIFGADAVLYVTVNEYGAPYNIIDSNVVAAADAKLVDLNTGALLWSGTASASSQENSNIPRTGVGILVNAIVKQVINTTSDTTSTQVAAIASSRLLSAGQSNGLLYGPRSPHYNKD